MANSEKKDRAGQGKQNANRSNPLGDTQPHQSREGTSQYGSGGQGGSEGSQKAGKIGTHTGGKGGRRS